MKSILKITLIVLVVTAGAGCSVTNSGGQEYIEAREVTDVPEDAPVISHDDERIDDVEPIQDVLEKAANDSGGSATIELSPAEAAQARDALEPLPAYDGNPGGYYVRKDNRTFVITFLKEQ